MNKQDQEKLNEIIQQPTTDADIKHFLGNNTKILKYADLSKYNNIHDLLPKQTDFVVLLFEQEIDKGHWVCICKNNDEISYFDPYGNRPSENFKWNSNTTNNELQQDKRSILNLFDSSNIPVFYNDFRYQKMENDINTCGRHVSFFIINNQQYGRSLDDYHDLMNYLKTTFKLNYDQIVSVVID